MEEEPIAIIQKKQDSLEIKQILQDNKAGLIGAAGGYEKSNG
jgi:hypothetical protein